MATNDNTAFRCIYIMCLQVPHTHATPEVYTGGYPTIHMVVLTGKIYALATVGIYFSHNNGTFML